MKHRMDALEFEPYEPPPFRLTIDTALLPQQLRRMGSHPALKSSDFTNYLNKLGQSPLPVVNPVKIDGGLLPNTTAEANVSGSYSSSYPTAQVEAASPSDQVSFLIPKGTSCAQAIKQLLQKAADNDPTIDPTWSLLPG